MHTQGIQDSPWAATAASDGGAGGGGDTGRSTPLRVDAQRNLQHVLRAAREVFGEVGYGAPMEDVARRARVGVGTVYRRFPSKEVLVRRIAEEETARLTEQARTALGQEDEPWQALSRFLRTSVASGAGRLLPPRILRVGTTTNGAAPQQDTLSAGGQARVPSQRSYNDGQPDLRLVQDPQNPRAAEPGQQRDVSAAGEHGDHEARPAAAGGSSGAVSGVAGFEPEEPGAAALLDVVGQLVERARSAGQLRADVTVADVLLVIATAAPSLPDAAQQSAASARLLDILLEGLRSRPDA